VDIFDSRLSDVNWLVNVFKLINIKNEFELW